MGDTTDEEKDQEEWIKPKKTARISSGSSTSTWKSPQKPSLHDGRNYMEASERHSIKYMVHPSKLSKCPISNKRQHDLDENIKRIPKKLKPPKSVTKSFRCKTCGKVGKSVDEIQNHVVDDHLKQFVSVVFDSDSNTKDDKTYQKETNRVKSVTPIVIHDSESEEEAMETSDVDETSTKNAEAGEFTSESDSELQTPPLDTHVTNHPLHVPQNAEAGEFTSESDSELQTPLLDTHVTNHPLHVPQNAEAGEFTSESDSELQTPPLDTHVTNHPLHVPQVVNGDCPVWSTKAEPYEVSKLVDILHSNTNICKRAPLPIFEDGIPKNCCFKVDSCVPKGDILASSNCGAWESGGAPTNLVVIHENILRNCTIDGDHGNIKIRVGNKWHTEKVPLQKVLMLQRYYSKNKSNTDFRRVFVTLRQYDNDKVPYPHLIHYYWIGAKVGKLVVRPHGNAKTTRPYIQTKPTLLASCTEELKGQTTASVYDEAFNNGGGIDANDLSSVIRNKGQLYNIKRKKPNNTTDQLADVIQQQEEEKDETKYVRKVIVQPSGPVGINFTEQQLIDLERFCTTDGVLSVDVTYNLGDFYVTTTAYNHKGLINPRTGTHPVFAGPTMVHFSNNTSVFKTFASELVNANPKLTDLKFGTDEDRAIYNGFEEGLRNKESTKCGHLLCFNHTKDSIKRKLRSLNFPDWAAREVIDDIFGFIADETKHKGIVDSNSEQEFEMRVESCQEKWDSLENKATQNQQPRFFNYFVQYKAQLMLKSMIAPIRTAAGLGNPPAPYTQNSVESVNNLCKQHAAFKKNDWATVNTNLKKIAESQRVESVKAVFGTGSYILSAEFNHLTVPPNIWRTLSKKERLKSVNTFTKYRSGTAVSKATESNTTLNRSNLPPDTNNHPLNKDNLPGTNSFKDEVWRKAIGLLAIHGSVMDAPGGGKTVLLNHLPETAPSKGGRNHVFVRTDKWSCECVTFASRHICFHVVAVAKKEGLLEECLAGIAKRSGKNQPRLMSLYRENIPKSAGRKPGQKVQKKKAPKQVVTHQVERIPLDVPPGVPFTEVWHNNHPWILCSVSEVKDPKKVCPSCLLNFPVNPHIVVRPFDIVFRHAERYLYPDKHGEWVPSRRDTRLTYYCVKRRCVMMRHPYFKPSMVIIQADLQDVHKNLLSEEFDLEV